MQLTLDYLKSIIQYNPETGDFYWIKPRKGARKDRPAGCISKGHGYKTICIDRVWHRSHRLAWFWMTGCWPIMEIDHIDRQKSNNKWSNLREASHSQNNINIGLKASNKSGVVGVSWDSGRKKWLAQIRISGIKKNLGRFDLKEDAINAWEAASCLSDKDFRA